VYQTNRRTVAFQVSRRWAQRWHLVIIHKSSVACTTDAASSKFFFSRCLSLSSSSLKDNKESENISNEGWLKKLLVRRIEPTKEQHSRMLSDKEVIYELQTHNVRPDSTDNYMKN